MRVNAIQFFNKLQIKKEYQKVACLVTCLEVFPFLIRLLFYSIWLTLMCFGGVSQQASEAQNLYFDTSTLLKIWQGYSHNSPKIFLYHSKAESKCASVSKEKYSQKFFMDNFLCFNLLVRAFLWTSC